MAVDRIFVDTNVLVYASLSRSALHNTALARLGALEEEGIELCVSRQVLREYLAVMSRSSLTQGTIPAESLIEDVRGFESSMTVLDEVSEVTTRLLDILATIPVGGKQIHDANIVATMLAGGVPAVLTNNVADFLRYKELITVIPLVQDQ